MKANHSSLLSSNRQVGVAIGGLCLAAASTASAAIVVTDVSALSLTISTDSSLDQSIFFDLDHSGGGSGPFAGTSAVALPGVDFRIYAISGFDPTTEKPVIGFNDSGVVDGKLAAGDLIGESPFWSPMNPYELEDEDVGPWNGTNGEGYLGLRLGATGPDSLYGWALIDYQDTANTLTLKSFAYETELDQPILAGVTAVPEPENAAMLAAMLSGSLLIRTRRKSLRTKPEHV
jgi:hypothetical protein